MAFPGTPLPLSTAIYTGEWEDITGHTRAQAGQEIVIRRGYADEGSIEPRSCTVTLDNTDGHFAPRNPLGQWYGTIGRNTPLRVQIGSGLAGDGYLHCERTGSWFFENAFSSGSGGVFAVASDIDVRVDALSHQWRTGTPLLARYNSSNPTGRSWALMVDVDGFLEFVWTTDGTEGTQLTATSTVEADLVNGERKALRAALDVDNGAGGWTVTFYTADTISGSWVQLGDAVTDTGTTSVHDAAALEAGHVPEFAQVFPVVRIYAAQLLDGIGGTALADVDFGTQEVGTTLFTDGAGRTWTVGTESGATSSVWITNPGLRYIGEVSEWPPKWDASGKDSVVAVTAQGVSRRLGQGTRPAKSPVRSTVDTNFFRPNGYWSLEETAGASFASGLSGGSPMTYSGTRPDFAATGAFLGSQALPILDSTTSLSAPVQPSQNGFIGVGMHIDVPVTTGWSDSTPLLWIEQSPGGTTVAMWEVRYRSGSGGDLEVRALSESGSQLATSGTLNVNIDGDAHRLHLRLLQSNGDVNWRLSVKKLNLDGDDIDETVQSGTFSSLTATHATRVDIAPAGGLDELGVGQIVVDLEDIVDDDALLSMAGEHAAMRAARLIDEIGVEARVVGTTTASEGVASPEWQTTPMGQQAVPATFSDALAECAPAEQGLLFETRDELGLTFRTRRSLINQLVALPLDYAAEGEITPPLEPLDDDQLVRNDVTVKRKGGSSARYVDSTSRMGIQPPPNGVGVYETEIEVNLEGDGVLLDHAAWRVHIGTWDEPRFRVVRINLAALALAGRTDLMAKVAALDVGDRIRLSNLPLHSGVVGDIDLMVLGVEERIGLYVWEVALNTRPYGPWQVGTWQATTVTSTDAPTRWDSAFSTVAMGLLLPGSSGSYASTPDVAALDITGDIDVRCRAIPTVWANEQDLVTKWQTADNERAFQLYLDASGNLVFEWSPDGASVEQAISTESVDSITASGPRSVRVTLDVDNGAGGWAVTFYVSTDADLSSATWTTLGDAVTETGTTSIFASTADLEAGSFGGGNSVFAGVIVAAQVRDGIAGTIVANPDFAAQPSGTTSFEDSAGLTWTVSGSAEVYGPFVTGTDDTLLVATAAGSLWTETGPFPLAIAVHGVELTVSDITGSSSPQTFTISDANLAAVTIPSGAEVHVADRGRRAL